ncbi:MAG: multiple antibiotic resistance protein [Verrucomicrobiales bacterium]|jgi:multiple antibiotic resistance protein
MTLLSAAVLLLLILDPFGNLVTINTLLREVAVPRRRAVILRESLIAFAVLIFFFLVGQPLLGFLGLEASSLSISGAIILFLIALGMVFPTRKLVAESLDEEPFIVPIALPLIAGPTTIAAILLMASSGELPRLHLLAAITIACSVSTLILWASPAIFRRLGHRGAVAVERLMGMLLVMIAVQMFLNGISHYLAAHP